MGEEGLQVYKQKSWDQIGKKKASSSDCHGKLLFVWGEKGKIGEDKKGGKHKIRSGPKTYDGVGWCDRRCRRIGEGRVCLIYRVKFR